MGAILSSCWDHLPPLMDILLPTPDVYLTLLNIFQYFPLFTIIQWLTAWHPAGKTSMKSSLFNLPGRWAWFAMEIVSPVNLLYVLWKLPLKLAAAHRTTTNSGSNADGSISISISIPLPNKLLAALFVAHYLNRAIISPFLAAPSMSPIHLFIMVSAMLFNWFNSTCLAGWLVGYDIPIRPASPYHPSSPPSNTAAAPGKVVPYLGLALFLAGMAGNIYAERTLFRLRREEGARRAVAADAAGGAGGAGGAASSKDPFPSPSPSHSPPSNPKPSSHPSTSTSKVYVIPPPSTPLFASILYPHYVCEWLEWTGFALAGTAVRSSASAGMLGLGLRSYTNPITTTATASTVAAAAAAAAASRPLHLAPWLRPAAQLAAAVGLPFPVPAAVFVVNAVTNMLPHARWGRRWYVERFGEEKVAGRGAVVPFCGWF